MASLSRLYKSNVNNMYNFENIRTQGDFKRPVVGVVFLFSQTYQQSTTSHSRDDKIFQLQISRLLPEQYLRDNTTTNNDNLREGSDAVLIMLSRSTGQWYKSGVLPYKSNNNGAVLLFQYDSGTRAECCHIPSTVIVWPRGRARQTYTARSIVQLDSPH